MNPMEVHLQFFLTDLVYLKNFSNFFETNTKLIL